MSATHGSFHWNELMTRDVAGAKAYCAAVCGWEYDEMQMPQGRSYHVGMAEGRAMGGIMDMGAVDGYDGVPPHWFAYIAVDEVDAAVARTREMGGTVRRDVHEVPGVGRIALIEDPAGPQVGIMTPAATSGS